MLFATFYCCLLPHFAEKFVLQMQSFCDGSQSKRVVLPILWRTYNNNNDVYDDHGSRHASKQTKYQNHHQQKVISIQAIQIG